MLAKMRNPRKINKQQHSRSKHLEWIASTPDASLRDGSAGHWVIPEFVMACALPSSYLYDRQDVFDAGVVPNLFIVVLQKQLVSPENERPALSESILDVLRRQILYADVVRGVLVRLADRLQRRLVVAVHHRRDGRGVPHRANAPPETQGVAGRACVVAEARRRVDAQLARELGRRLAGPHAHEEHPVDRRQHLVSKLRRVLPAQESPVVAEERHGRRLVADAERRGRPPLVGEDDWGGIGRADQRRGPEAFQDAGGR
ncbi:hypothetical protein THAOC_06750 [Thalassiosira oceanica]|uniref:Uncharacterized protein n=1 Tax=Thalassiosira oceanica TaxID=159749 RepID=K0T3U8_THAOC|nr:hypothetical protein THAOC_06750 [Thalassiosira oceanica]|eukprot:EJK71779.1 hypothetical protein THAOC_06750 [Thalassiosira oceanica]